MFMLVIKLKAYLDAFLYLQRTVQARVYFLRRLANFNICSKLLFYQLIVSRVLFYAVIGWKSPTTLWTLPVSAQPWQAAAVHSGPGGSCFRSAKSTLLTVLFPVFCLLFIVTFSVDVSRGSIKNATKQSAGELLKSFFGTISYNTACCNTLFSVLWLEKSEHSLTELSGSVFIISLE